MKKSRTSSPIPNRTKNKDRCPHPGCDQVGNWCRGFCITHYRVFREQCKNNGSSGRKDDEQETKWKMLHPELEKPWEYTNDAGEAELIAMQEQRDRDHKRKKESAA